MYRKKCRNFKRFMAYRFSIFTPTHLVTYRPRFIAYILTSTLINHKESFKILNYFTEYKTAILNST